MRWGKRVKLLDDEIHRDNLIPGLRCGYESALKSDRGRLTGPIPLSFSLSRLY